MRENGQVVKVESDTLLVRMCPQDEGRCGSCGCCGGSGADRTLRLKLDENPKAERAVPGDTVELEINLPNPGTAAAILFGLPILDMVCGAGLGWYAFGQTDTALLVGGAVGILFGLVEVAVINSMLKGKGMGVRVVDVLKHS